METGVNYVYNELRQLNSYHIVCVMITVSVNFGLTNAHLPVIILSFKAQLMRSRGSTFVISSRDLARKREGVIITRTQRGQNQYGERDKAKIFSKNRLSCKVLVRTFCGYAF